MLYFNCFERPHIFIIVKIYHQQLLKVTKNTIEIHLMGAIAFLMVVAQMENLVDQFHYHY